MVAKKIEDNYAGQATGTLKTNLDPIAEKVLTHYSESPSGHALLKSDLGTKFDRLEVKLIWYKDNDNERLDWRYEIKGINVETTLS